MADNAGTGGGQGAAAATGGAAAPQTGQGTGGAGSYAVPDTSAGTAAAARSSSRDEDHDSPREEFVSVHVSKLVKRYGSLQNALDVLAADLYDRREQDRLNPRPPAGAMVLVGADVQTWQQYQGLGLPPDKVKEALAERDRLAAQDRQTTQGTQNEQAIQAVGWKNPQALGELLTAKGLTLDMRDVQVVEPGKQPTTKRMPYVRKTGDDKAAWEALPDYVNTNASVWVSALTTAPQGGSGTDTTGPAPKGGQGAASGTRTGTQSQSTGTNGTQGGAAPSRVVVSAGQPTGQETAAGATSPVDRRLARNREQASAANALRPAAPKPAT